NILSSLGKLLASDASNCHRSCVPVSRLVVWCENGKVDPRWNDADRMKRVIVLIDSCIDDLREPELITLHGQPLQDTTFYPSLQLITLGLESLDIVEFVGLRTCPGDRPARQTVIRDNDIKSRGSNR